MEMFWKRGVHILYGTTIYILGSGECPYSMELLYTYKYMFAVCVQYMFAVCVQSPGKINWKGALRFETQVLPNMPKNV